MSQCPDRFSLLDQIPLGICVLQSNYDVVFWNRCLEEWTKISRDRIVGHSICDFFPHFNQPLYVNRLTPIFAGGPPTIFSSQLHKHVIPAILSHGQKRIQHTTVTAIPVDEGDGFYAMLSIQDVTDLTSRIQSYRQMRDQAIADADAIKRSAKALRESEERFRTSVENMLDCFAIYRSVRNEQGDIIDFQAEYVNDAVCLVSQMTREQHLTQRLCELLPAHRDSGLFDEYCQVVETGRSLVKDSLMYEDQFGQQRLTKAFDIRAAKFGDGYVATWRDITDRKQTEQALRDSEEALRQREEQFRFITNTIPQIVWTTDSDGDTDYVNQRWTDYTGLSLEAALNVGWQNLIHPDDLPPVQAFWTKACKTALSYEIEYRLRRSDGMFRWHLVKGLPMRNQHGQVIKWFGTCTDIHDQKELEFERHTLLEREQAARAEAERANRIKDDFLAVLSHELRSPLNPILGWAKLLQTGNFDATRTAEALATIERNARLQTQLIDDLLDVAKILRGKLSMEMAPVDLVFVIEAAIDTVRAAATAKSIHLHPILPQIGQVSGDAARLQQIVWNLLSNAIKFTPMGGSVDIELSLVTDPSSAVHDQPYMAQYAQIAVRDTGKGIKPDFLPYIFESFRQEDISTTRQYGGLGLGLAIVRHLVEAHGGTIWADSKGEGHGATFTVRFPLLAPRPDRNQPEDSSKQDLDLTGIRVLTVDDEPDARALLNALLTQYGAEVLMVTSAAEVLASLELFQPHVLISDIGMPETDGYSLIQQIRALSSEQGGQVPAIALTAYVREEDHQHAINSGYQRHITKPLDLEQLVRAVMALTDSKPLPISEIKS
ncbi:MAG TPA: PAS domain S-box protein [Crinalium sp.]